MCGGWPYTAVIKMLWNNSMKQSTKLHLYDSLKISAEIEEGEKKEIEFRGYPYIYRVDKYTFYKNYYSLILVGGPYRLRATTTCKKEDIKKCLKKLIIALNHK